MGQNILRICSNLVCEIHIINVESLFVILTIMSVVCYPPSHVSPVGHDGPNKVGKNYLLTSDRASMVIQDVQ